MRKKGESKRRLDRGMSQHYHHRSYKKIVSRKELSRADMTIVGAQSSHGEEISDGNVEDGMCLLLGHHLMAKERDLHVLVAASQSEMKWRVRMNLKMGVRKPVLMRKRYLMWKKSFHKLMSTWGHPPCSSPKNPRWRQKNIYKGKIEVVRKKRRDNPRLHAREVTDYRFHIFFQ
jgi:hypothetical protein